MRKGVLSALAFLGAITNASLCLATDGKFIDIEKTDAGDLESAGLEIVIYIDSPRTAAEMKDIEDQLNRTGSNMCDYTDGFFHITKVTFTNNPADKKRADIWWMRMDETSCSGFGFGRESDWKCTDTTRTAATKKKDKVAGTRVSMYSDVNGGTGFVSLNGEVLSHEFGHLIFEVEDEYGDPRAQDHASSYGVGVNGFSQVESIYSQKKFFRNLHNDEFIYSPAALKDILFPGALDPVPTKQDGSSPLYTNQGADGSPWWKLNLSVMQQVGMAQCRSADDRRPYDFDPIIQGGWGCRVDDDCKDRKGIYIHPTYAPIQDYDKCTIAATASELTLTENLGLNRYDRTLGDVVPTIDTTTSRIRQAKELVLQGFLVPSYYDKLVSPTGLVVAAPQNASSLSITNGAVANEFLCKATSSGMESQDADVAYCPNAKAPGSPNGASSGADKLATCFGNVYVDTSACKPAMDLVDPTLCGNGTIDGNADIGEECDTSGSTSTPVADPDTGGDLTCDKVYSPWRVANGESRVDTEPSVKFLSGSKVYCRTNCTFDLSRCSLPLGESLVPVATGATLKELADKSDRFMYAEVYDDKGEILPRKGIEGNTSSPDFGKADFGHIGPSNHIMWAFLKQLGRTRDATNGAPAGMPDPGAHDLWEVTFAMDEFEFSLDATKWGQAHVLKTIQIEFATDKDNNKGPVALVDGNAYVGGDKTTWPKIKIAKNSLKRGTSNAIELAIDLDNLDTVQTLNGDGSTYTNKGRRTSLYARHGTTTYGSVRFEMPQYGSAKFWLLQKKMDEGKSCDPGSACMTEVEKEARFRELIGFNKATGRFDTPFNMSDQLLRSELYTNVANDDTAMVSALTADAHKYIKPGWEKLKETLCNRFDINVPIPTKVYDIKGKPDPATCPGIDFVPKVAQTVEFDETTQIVLVLDRSGSMASEEGAGEVDGKPMSRLDYLKSGGLDIMRQMAANVYARRSNATSPNPGAVGPKIGLVWYSDTPEVKFPIAGTKSCSSDADCADDPADPSDNASGVCLISVGKCKSGMPRLECDRIPDPSQPGATRAECPYLTGADSRYISPQILETAYMSLTAEGRLPIPEPNGWTGTGAALKAAADLFDDDSKAKTKVVILFTDGFHNRPSGGACFDGTTPYVDDESCWPGANATAVYDEALETFKNKDILLYTIPLGASAEKSAMSIAEGETSGEVFQAHSPGGEDTIPAFSEAYAALTGQQFVRSSDELPTIRGGIYNNPTEYEIPVEAGARALHVTVSNANALEDGFEENFLDGELVSPSGVTHKRYRGYPYDADEIRPLSGRFDIPDPEQGTWVFRDVTQSRTDPNRHSRFLVTGLVDNPVPMCEASVGLQVSDGTLPVLVRAKASNDRPIVSGDTYVATLQRPDMTIVNLSFESSGSDKPATAEVGPSLFTGDGLYVANITCSVAEGAKLAKSSDPLPGQNPFPQRTSHAFTRQVHAYFVVRGSGIVAVPGLNGDNQDPSVLAAKGLPPTYSPVRPFLEDADRDGIPNDDEPAIWVDSDNDGKPDVYDRDSNGNEIPDGVDPGIPYSPAANGTGSHCGLSNCATCCTSIGTCVGALPRVAVYAEGGLSLRDRAVVEVAGSGRATIVNAGTDLTELGVNAKAGNVLSAATIHLNAGARITGYARTAGTVTLDTGANQPAPAYQNATVGLKPLSGFSVMIPGSGTLAEVGGGLSIPIAPGTYGDLRIQPSGTAYLSSGTYYVQSLDLEPQAILALDMSSGPIYLYVANSVIYRGSIITTAGKSSDLFVGYMGTQTAALEVPFTGTFVAPNATLLLGPPSGGASFSGGFYAADVEVRPDVVVEALPFGHVWLSSSSTGGGTGGGSTGGGGSGSFTCTGACLSATPISRYQFSGNFNTTSEVWFVTSEVPNGWQASNVEGRQILVNGMAVTVGQIPLPAPVGGKYYFQFTSGGVAVANWSFW